MREAAIVIALWVFICIVLFMLPLPVRCDRRWCFRQQVGYSIYCRKHTDEITGRKTYGQ